MSNPIALPEIFQAAFEDFIIPSYETAPFTTIQNRAMVTRSLKAIAGVERVHTKGINLLQNEFGPNGEQVWEADNKDARIRFAGSGWSNVSSTSGAYPSTSTIGDFLEITFYGTGLNISLSSGHYYFAGNHILTALVDGATVAGITSINSGMTNLLGGRNYCPNYIYPVISGLSLGWHTAKITWSYTTLTILNIFGFEVLNQRTDLAVYSGAGISNGSIQGLSALATSAFNTGVSGTRGARVVKYVQGGVVSQAVQEVDATSKYLTLADHTNEEVVRRINFREFGANRADDFSTLAGTGSSRAFTLDDGTTTLVGLTVKGDTALSTIDALRAQAGVTNFFTKTFIGTGLDIIISCDATIRSTTVLVDGVSVGTLTSAVTINGVIYKICSGLPYGTHTIKFLNTSAGSDTFGVSDFIIYQPKTPSIPVGAFEVARYNVMASYVASGAGNGINGIVSQGVLRKMAPREVTYVGTWLYIGAVDVNTFNCGWNIQTTTVASYMEYTFFGTGVQLHILTDGVDVQNRTVTVNGLTPAAAGGTVSIQSSGTGVTFSSAGAVAGTSSGSQSCSLRITGLALGVHRVRITNNSTTEMYIDAVDIITPIHSQVSSLKVGSESLKSVTKYSPEKSVLNAGPDLSKAKAWVRFDQVNNKILASYNVSAVLGAGNGISIIYFEKPFKNTNYIVTGMGENPLELAGVNVPYEGNVTVGFRSSGVLVPDAFGMVCIFGELKEE